MADDPATVRFVESSAGPVDAPDGLETRNGAIQLIWDFTDPPDNAEAWSFEVQKATDPEFSETKIRYAGPDTGTYLSGLSGGMHWFRLRAIDPDGNPGPWSQPALIVEVKYAEGWLVAALMIVGAIVFVATVTVVVGSHLKTMRGGEPEHTEA